MPVDDGQPDPSPAGYCALIRTSNSVATIPATISSLEQQTLPPQQWVFVDNDSTDGIERMIPAAAELVTYELDRYNHSHALNQGVRSVRTPYTLIISSHTAILNERSMAYVTNLLDSDPALGAAYLSHEGEGELLPEIVDRDTFDGFNGLWNSCSIVRTSLLRERQFRTEVFTSEDQEWASWLIRERGLNVARISGAGRRYERPGGQPPEKRANEYFAIALFVRRDLLGIKNCSVLFLRAGKHFLLGNSDESRFFAIALSRILRANVRRLVHRARAVSRRHRVTERRREPPADSTSS